MTTLAVSSAYSTSSVPTLGDPHCLPSRTSLHEFHMRPLLYVSSSDTDRSPLTGLHATRFDNRPIGSLLGFLHLTKYAKCTVTPVFYEQERVVICARGRLSIFRCCLLQSLLELRLFSVFTVYCPGICLSTCLPKKQ